MLRSLEDIVEVMFSVQRCVLNEDFQGPRAVFCSAIKRSLVRLAEDSSDVSILCITAITEGGQNLRGEREVLASAVRSANGKQRALLGVYADIAPAPVMELAPETLMPKACKQDPEIEIMKPRDWEQPGGPEKPTIANQMSLADETLVAFALSYSAMRLSAAGTAMVETLGDKATLGPRVKHYWPCRKCFPRPSLDYDHMLFVLRKFIPVSLCFVWGIHFPRGKIFPSYSANMAATLSLLVTRRQDKYSGIHDNIQRILGVTLGHLLPILMLAFLTLSSSCGDSNHVLMHVFGMWLYVFMFTYMYYTSPRWSITGCLISGFGVQYFFVPCLDVESLTESYKERYLEIAQVTLAIVLQVLADGVLKTRRPGDIAEERLSEVTSTLKQGFKSFLEQAGTKELRAAAREARMRLRAYVASARDFDPSLRLVPLLATPFRVQLYKASLRSLQKLASDIYMFALAVDPSQLDDDKHRDLEEVWGDPVVKKAVGDMLQVMDTVMATLTTTLSHTSELPINGAKDWADDHAAYLARWAATETTLYEVFSRVATSATFSFADSAPPSSGVSPLSTLGTTETAATVHPVGSVQAPQSVAGLCGNIHARTAVAARALSNAMLHLGAIHENCMKENIY